MNTEDEYGPEGWCPPSGPLPQRLAPLMSSSNPNWETPDSVLGLVRQVFGGQIELDPCTTERNPTDAVYFYCPPGDGLKHPWANCTYVNPPYGRGIGEWVDKCAAAGCAGKELIALLPARTDARWWQDNVTSASAICFWRGRLKFRGAKHAAPFPSAVVYWGKYVDRFREAFGTKEWIVRP